MQNVNSKHMKKLLFLGLMFAMLSCTQSAKNEYTYWVNSYQVNCSGVGKMSCLLVQKADIAEVGEWQNFSSKIEGFEFEPGYLYKLKVKEEAVENPPADASSIKYTLVEVLEKTEDPKFKINNSWLIISINGEAVEVGTGRENAALEFSIPDMRMGGSNGCNRLMGSIQKFDDGIIEFGPIAGTMMMCPNMTIPEKLDATLPLIKLFELDGDQLILKDADENELIVAQLM